MALADSDIALFLVTVPCCIGAGAAAFVDKQERNPLFMWISGYLVMFAFFQVLAVPLILKRQHFTLLCRLFGGLSAVAALTGIAVWIFRQKKYTRLQVVRQKRSLWEKALWAVFAAGLLTQLFLAVFLAFSDGDDAYYVAVSTVTESADSMYVILPYTGGETGLDTRHGLAPFPLFIAFLARVSGIHPATVAQIAMPLALIPLTYGIYGMIGSRLLKGKQKWLPLFLIFAELVIVWGNYSLNTAETFLMTRTRQGKAALGNLIIPALFLLLYLIGERLQENRRIEKSLWLLLLAGVTAACLCSTFGGFLVMVLLGVFSLCVVCTYRKWKLLLPLMLCLIPAAVYAGLFIVLK